MRIRNLLLISLIISLLTLPGVFAQDPFAGVFSAITSSIITIVIFIVIILVMDGFIVGICHKIGANKFRHIFLFIMIAIIMLSVLGQFVDITAAPYSYIPSIFGTLLIANFIILIGLWFRHRIIKGLTKNKWKLDILEEKAEAQELKAEGAGMKARGMMKDARTKEAVMVNWADLIEDLRKAQLAGDLQKALQLRRRDVLKEDVTDAVMAMEFLYKSGVNLGLGSDYNVRKIIRKLLFAERKLTEEEVQRIRGMIVEAEAKYKELDGELSTLTKKSPDYDEKEVQLHAIDKEIHALKTILGEELAEEHFADHEKRLLKTMGRLEAKGEAKRAGAEEKGAAKATADVMKAEGGEVSPG